MARGASYSLSRRPRRHGSCQATVALSFFVALRSPPARAALRNWVICSGVEPMKGAYSSAKTEAQCEHSEITVSAPVASKRLMFSAAKTSKKSRSPISRSGAPQQISWDPRRPTSAPAFFKRLTALFSVCFVSGLKAYRHPVKSRTAHFSLAASLTPNSTISLSLSAWGLPKRLSLSSRFLR